MSVLRRILVFAALIASAAPARADEEFLAELEEGPHQTVHLDFGATTELPLVAGARFDAEWWFRLRSSLTVGFLPPPYLDLINEVATSAEWYNDQTAQLIEEILDNTLIVRLHVGFRPHPRYGFFFDAGYTVAALSGGASSAELIEAATNRPRPDQDVTFDASSTLHMLGARVGYEWIIKKVVTIRLDFGGAFTLGASTDVVPSRQSPAINQYARSAERYLNDVYTSYVHTPTIGLSVAYRWSL